MLLIIYYEIISNMRYKEGVESEINDYNKGWATGENVLGKVLNPLLALYFEKNAGFDEMIEVANEVFRGIALEYGRDDILESCPSIDPKRFRRLINLLSEMAGFKISESGMRALAMFEMFAANIPYLVARVISEDGVGKKYNNHFEVSIPVGQGVEKLTLPAWVLDGESVLTAGLIGERVGSVLLVWGEDRIIGEEIERARKCIGEMVRLSAQGGKRELWMEGLDQLVVYVGMGVSGMRALKVSKSTDRGIILVGSGMLGGDVCLAEILMYFGHELNHLSIFRRLLEEGESLLSVALSEYMADEEGLRLGRRIEAPEKVIKRWEEATEKYQRIMNGEGGAAFLTNWWEVIIERFNRPGMADDWRRIAKVVDGVLEEGFVMLGKTENRTSLKLKTEF